MARKALIEKNKTKIAVVKRYEKKRKELKDAIYDKTISIKERYLLQKKLTKLPRNSSKIRVRNICFLTGRTRGVSKKFGISRTKLRELAGKLLIPGLTKSSW